MIRACSGFWSDSENELKFAPNRREKRGTSLQGRGSVFPTTSGNRTALNEHFRNEMGVNFSQL